MLHPNTTFLATILFPSFFLFLIQPFPHFCPKYLDPCSLAQMLHSCICFPKTGSSSCAPAHISPPRHYPCPPANIGLGPFGPFLRLGLPIRPTLLNAFFPSLPPLPQVSLPTFQWDFKAHVFVSRAAESWARPRVPTSTKSPARVTSLPCNTC